MKNKGITLVALVITIILLLILSGITIQALTGTGLFEKAKQAAEETKYANAMEKVALAVNASYDNTGTLNRNMLMNSINKIDGLKEKIDSVEEIKYDLKIIVDGYEFLISELGQITAVGREQGLPPNTPQTPAGEKVALKEGWGTQAVKYIKTSDGTEVKELETVSTVYAVSVGSGETVPVPNKFYYVGGNLETGVVISDSEEDEYGRGVASGTDKTAHNYAPNLKGNQFVWIPCNINDYTKYNWGYYDNSWETLTNTAEKVQIEKYGGFYVGRYEAGTSKVELKNGLKIEDGIGASGWSSDSCKIGNTTTNSKPTSRANEIPYYHADYETAEQMSERMYTNNYYVKSGLITGTQWDVMLNYISNEDKDNKSIANALDENYYKDLKSECTWGNYNNTVLKNCRGRYSIASKGGTAK